MKSAIVLVCLSACVCLVQMHNSPKPDTQVVQVVQVQEVKPAKEEQQVIPVAIDLSPMKQHVGQTVYNSWPLLCLVPKLALLKPSLKVACHQLVVKAAGSLYNKAVASKPPLRLNVHVVKPNK